MQQHVSQEMQKAEFVFKNLQPTRVGKDLDILKTIVQVALVLLGWLSISLEVFVRHEFGERYLSWTKLYLAYITLAFARLFIFLTLALFGLLNSLRSFSIFGGAGDAGAIAIPQLFTIVTLAFVILSLYHRFRIYRRSKQNIHWHSNSFGISHLKFLPFGDWTLYRIVEPGLFITLGLLLRFVEPITGTWLILSACALLVKNQMTFATLRGHYLDMIDGQIEANYFQGALDGKPKAETAGFSVIPVPVGDLFAAEAEAVDIAATVSESLGEGATVS